MGSCFEPLSARVEEAPSGAGPLAQRDGLARTRELRARSCPMW
jgi:hypothetical protein